MKKISLKTIEANELLSREELKQITGGFTGSGSGDCPEGEVPCTCTSGSGSYSGCVSSVQECWDKC